MYSSVYRSYLLLLMMLLFETGVRMPSWTPTWYLVEILILLHLHLSSEITIMHH